MSASPSLTVFYDGQCPLCLAEMRQLKASDRDDLIHLADLHAEDFEQQYPNIDRQQAQRILHGQLASDELLTGLDVTCTAWSLVGRHRWLAMLRWPGVRWLADGAYRLFARYRHPIAALLTGKARCTEACALDAGQNTHHRGSPHD